MQKFAYSEKPPYKNMETGAYLITAMENVTN
jgi:hypothetical protein